MISDKLIHCFGWPDIFRCSGGNKNDSRKTMQELGTAWYTCNARESNQVCLKALELSCLMSCCKFQRIIFQRIIFQRKHKWHHILFNVVLHKCISLFMYQQTYWVSWLEHIWIYVDFYFVPFSIRIVLHHQISASDVQYTLACVQVTMSHCSPSLFI